jgi:hypothetical protein
MLLWNYEVKHRTGSAVGVSKIILVCVTLIKGLLRIWICNITYTRRYIRLDSTFQTWHLLAPRRPSADD